STSQRNIGVALGHSVLALSNVTKGMGQLQVAAPALAADLDTNWEVLGEAIQTVMRAEALNGAPGMDNPYERLKELTRGHRVDAERMREFVGSLGLPEAAEQRLLALTPDTYTGLAARLAHEHTAG
ncbi:MAG: adenylosuccinate lyase, partial [Micrococcaceae bacterium]